MAAVPLRPHAPRALLSPEILEWIFTLAVIGFLAWQAMAFRQPGFTRGAGDRYAAALDLRVDLPPQARGDSVAALCARYGGWLAGDSGACAGAARAAREPVDPEAFIRLSDLHNVLAQALAQPVAGELSRLKALGNVAREARTDTDVQGAMEQLRTGSARYREAYGMGDPGGTAGDAQSLPLQCAWESLAQAYQGAPDDARRAAALIAMGALLDGASTVPAVSSGTAAQWPAALAARCAAQGSPRDALIAAHQVVARARASDANAGKSAAAMRLLQEAPWYLAAWAVAGLALLQAARRGWPLRRMLPLAVLTWSVLGWLTRVHIEWPGEHGAHAGWQERLGLQWPLFFQVLAGVAALALVWGLVTARGREPGGLRETPSARAGFAGFVLFTGLGWWLMLDLSATGHYANRFQGLYQQLYVFAAFVLLSMLAALRLPLAQGLGRALGRLLLATRSRGVARRGLSLSLYIGAAALVLAGAAATHARLTQLTSEIFRLWLVLGAAWFFLLRGEAALAPRPGGHRVMLSLLPLLFVLAVPVAGLVVTDDFGPLFVMLYAGSVFVGSALAFASLDRAGFRPWLGAVSGVLASGAWVFGLTAALYALPAPTARIAERLASAREPFAATNDQMAIITWFQESAPPGGYGLGSVPWCGELAGISTGSTACRGVPKQIQSDYVFTALVGEYGKAAALGLVILLAAWLVRLVAQHGRATRGAIEPASPRATQQAWLSWVAVCWVGLTLAQLAVTVAGNYGWLPLTGITFPFASYGAWSLLANTFFLALAIHLPRKA
jgi:cell division protein FtsW (lipid II flippase)